MQRYFIQLSYDGTAYHGWQMQENTLLTVQQVLNEMLSKLLNEPISIMGCGRTDAGVHATEFFAHFDSHKTDLTDNADWWVFKFNRALPADIAIQRIFPVHERANVRFDATARTYKYYISRKKDPFRVNKALYLFGDLNVDDMQKAAQTLFEYTDFTSFARTHTQNTTNNCTIYKAEWTEQEDGMLVFTISANRFLRNMVRAIVGTMLKVGKGKASVDDFKKIIESKDRTKAGLSALACGLYLVKVSYPESLLNGEEKNSRSPNA